MLVANRASTEVIDAFIDLNKGTVYLSSELFPFFCMYIVLPFSPFLLKIEDKVVHIAQRSQKRGVKKKSVNREKHEKDKMTEDSNTHGSEES
jgi:hypothetical protein